jgi:uncharacterized membrane protein YraQ (UPF0718 family)
MDLTIITYLVLAIILLAISFFKDREKTRLALKASVKTFSSLFPLLLLVFVLMGLSQAYVSRETIAALLGGSNALKGILLGAAIGCVALIAPAAIFPVGGYLYQNGAHYGAVAALIVTAILIGITTLPVEIRTFGWRFTLARNIVTFFLAILIGLSMWRLG